MSTSNSPLRTPSEILAEKILVTLADKKLVLPEDAKRMAANFADGKLRSEDWRIVIEKGIDKRTSK